MLHHRCRSASGSKRLSFIASSYANSDTITIPTHQIGDFIIIQSITYDLATNSLPSGWTRIHTTQTLDSRFICQTGYRIATSTSTTSGDWGAGANHYLACYVWRGTSSTSTIGSSNSRLFDDSDLVIPGITCDQGNSWIISLAASIYYEVFTTDGEPTDLPGMTLRFNTSTFRRAWDSNGPKSSLSQQTISTASDVFYSITFEVQI